MDKPLESTKVIDLTYMLAGPHAGMVLADLGAEVIKVEPLFTGEMTRSLHLGQHTEEILKNWCNYSQSDIEGLVKKEVIAYP